MIYLNVNAKLMQIKSNAIYKKKNFQLFYALKSLNKSMI